MKTATAVFTALPQSEPRDPREDHTKCIKPSSPPPASSPPTSPFPMTNWSTPTTPGLMAGTRPMLPPSKRARSSRRRTLPAPLSKRPRASRAALSSTRKAFSIRRACFRALRPAAMTKSPSLPRWPSKPPSKPLPHGASRSARSARSSAPPPTCSAPIRPWPSRCNRHWASAALPLT